MNIHNLTPNENAASSVVHLMTGEKVISVERMATGDQNFVYAVKTSAAEYIIRMTDVNHKYKFQSAISWQKMLLPIGVPLAEFIQSDLDGKYSPYPALLMHRLPGDDLINAYPRLTNEDKRNLANEMINIQALCTCLPEGPGFGILDSYDVIPPDKSWHEFISNRLYLYKDHITKNAVFDPNMVSPVIESANSMEENFNIIKPTPFLWDASERNVLIHNGKISGIVDVDEICFGDLLLVIALTSTCLELEGHDTVYTDCWAETLHLDLAAQARLNFYKLFYAVAFMRKHAMQTANSKKALFDTDKLLQIYNHSLAQMNI